MLVKLTQYILLAHSGEDESEEVDEQILLANAKDLGLRRFSDLAEWSMN
jgi:hypothetical protein